MADHFEREMQRPRELLPPSLLLLLAEAPGHGYELMERLKPLGFDWDGPGPIYRELRQLETAGLVESKWAVGETGPGRRVYEITSAGRATLDRSVAGVLGLQALATHFLSRVRRLPPAFFTAIPPTPTPASAGHRRLRRGAKSA